MTHIRSGIPPAHQGPVSHPRPARTSSPFLLRLIPPRTASPVTFPSLPLPETRQLLQAPSEVKRQSVFSTQHVPIYDHEFIFPSRSTPRPIACARCQFQLDACARHMFSHGRSPLVFTKHAPTCCDDTHVRGAPEMYPVPPPPQSPRLSKAITACGHPLIVVVATRSTPRGLLLDCLFHVPSATWAPSSVMG